MRNQLDIDKFYVSPYDKMFHSFDQNHKTSESQKKEITKHRRIEKLRDNADIADDGGTIWEDF